MVFPGRCLTAGLMDGAQALASKSPEDFRKMLRGQVTKFVKITKALAIKLD